MFVNKLDSQFILPCRQTLKEKFVKNYDTKRNDLIGEISQINSKISLITDIWTSDSKIVILKQLFIILIIIRN